MRNISGGDVHMREATERVQRRTGKLSEKSDKLRPLHRRRAGCIFHLGINAQESPACNCEARQFQIAVFKLRVAEPIAKGIERLPVK